MKLLAGAARSEITPEPGIPLLGYAARRGTAHAIHDKLFARALCLLHREQETAGLLVVAADLCLMTPAQALEVRERLAAETGLLPRDVLVSCTHTHSGPDMGLAAIARGQAVPDYVPRILSGLVEAGRAAHAARRPAGLAWSRCQVHIGRNRRLAAGPLDPDVLVLRVQDEDAGPIALLYQHGCHATVLGHENLEISADWPGVAAERIERETGAVALFLPGAQADIDPRTRGLKDLAISGQSLGLGFDAVEVLGSEVAQAVLDSGSSSQTPGLAGPIRASTERLQLALHLGELSAEQAQHELARRKQELAQRLGISVEHLPRLSELESFVRDRARGLPAPEARERIALLRSYVRDKTAPFFVGGQRQLDVEVQVLQIGGMALLGLPLELTAEVGLDWKARVGRRGLLGAVVSIANGWLRYLPHPRDLAHPQAHLHYEVLSSLFADGACEKLLGTGEQLLDRLLLQAWS
jgi:hypothetical protein